MPQACLLSRKIFKTLKIKFESLILDVKAVFLCPSLHALSAGLVCNFGNLSAGVYFDWQNQTAQLAAATVPLF